MVVMLGLIPNRKYISEKYFREGRSKSDIQLLFSDWIWPGIGTQHGCRAADMAIPSLQTQAISERY